MREFIPFVDERIFVGWDDITGHGVYARSGIPSGEFVEMAPVVVTGTMPEDENLARYVIAWNGRFGVPLGWTMLYNHSDKNSCAYSSNFHDSLLGIMTLREIAAGEQLTVNYGPNWFLSRKIEKVKI
jgi:SET domain-containing protein